MVNINTVSQWNSQLTLLHFFSEVVAESRMLRECVASLPSPRTYTRVEAVTVYSV